ncbi:hypothetical protein [Pseudomonas sp. EA_5y_Pfl2_R50]|uniref:hypothetical protein n=1 Tax=Pseudomonas sp. EA_5y_Pfl2_R50 TaxID=3088691 RepID=UPI0030D6DE10
MNKPVPDPPLETTTPLEDALRADDQLKNREAIKRALDFYLSPDPIKPRLPSTMFLVHPNVDTESLLPQGDAFTMWERACSRRRLNGQHISRGHLR